MKNPKPILKANSSRPLKWQFNKGAGCWLELGPNWLMVVGNAGLWAGVWVNKRDDWLEDITDTESGFSLNLKPTVQYELIMGDLTNWRPTTERNLQAIRRHHGQWLRPNYYSSERDFREWGYVNGKNKVTVNKPKLGNKLNFIFTPSVKAIEVWQQPPIGDSYSHQLAAFVLAQILLGEPAWQRPDAWVKFISRYSTSLSPEFIEQVVIKLLTQFDSDFSDYPHKLGDTAALQQVWLKRGRESWWRVHFESCLQLALCAGRLNIISKNKKLFSNLYGYIYKELSSQNPIYCNGGIKWFDGYIQSYFYSRPPSTQNLAAGIKEYGLIAKKYFPQFSLSSPQISAAAKKLQISSTSAGEPTRFNGWPLSIAECQSLLDNNK